MKELRNISRFEVVVIFCVILFCLGFLMLYFLILDIIKDNYVNLIYIIFITIFGSLLMLVLPSKFILTNLILKGKFSALLSNSEIEKNSHSMKQLLLMTKRLKESSYLFLILTSPLFLFILFFIIILANYNITIQTAIWIWLLGLFALVVWPLSLYVSATRFERLLEYPKAWKEAKIYLILSQISIKKDTLGAVLLFKHSLLTLNKNLGKIKFNLKSLEVLQRINVMCRNPHLYEEILSKYLRKLVSAIESFSLTHQDIRKFKEDVCRSLLEFVREEKLQKDLDYWKLNKRPSLITRINESPTLSVMGVSYFILLIIFQILVGELWQISLILGAMFAPLVLIVILARSELGNLIKVLEEKYMIGKKNT